MVASLTNTPYSADINRLLTEVYSYTRAFQTPETPAAVSVELPPIGQVNAASYSYMEPSLSFSVQQYLSAEPEGKNTAGKYAGDVYRDNSSATPETGAVFNTLSFGDELSRQTKPLIYARAAGIYGSSPVSGAINNMLGKDTLSVSALEYAVNSYNYVYNINRRPQVLIDFMHEYNRSYDIEI